MLIEFGEMRKEIKPLVRKAANYALPAIAILSAIAGGERAGEVRAESNPNQSSKPTPELTVTPTPTPTAADRVGVCVFAVNDKPVESPCNGNSSPDSTSTVKATSTVTRPLIEAVRTPVHPAARTWDPCNPNNYFPGQSISIIDSQNRSLLFAINNLITEIVPADPHNPGNATGTVIVCIDGNYNAMFQMNGGGYSELTSNPGQFYRGVIEGITNKPGTNALFLGEGIDDANGTVRPKGGEFIPDYNNPNTGRNLITSEGLPGTGTGELDSYVTKNGGTYISRRMQFSNPLTYEIKTDGLQPLQSEVWHLVDNGTPTSVVIQGLAGRSFSISESSPGQVLLQWEVATSQSILYRFTDVRSLETIPLPAGMTQKLDILPAGAGFGCYELVNIPSGKKSDIDCIVPGFEQGNGPGNFVGKINSNGLAEFSWILPTPMDSQLFLQAGNIIPLLANVNDRTYPPVPGLNCSAVGTVRNSALAGVSPFICLIPASTLN